MASGEMTRAEFVTFLVDYLRSMVAHLKDGAIVDCCMDWRHLSEALEAIDKAGLSLINLCVWNKTNGGMGSLYRSKHELVLIAKKGKAPHINNVELGKNGRYRTNVWDYAGVNSFGATRDADLADHARVPALEMASRRDVREDKWRDPLPLARSRQRGRNPRKLRDQDPRQEGSAGVHEEGSEAPRIT